MTLFPECVDDWIDKDNPVRVIDAFVDWIDLGESASMVSCPKRQVGRPIAAFSTSVIPMV